MQEKSGECGFERDGQLVYLSFPYDMMQPLAMNVSVTPAKPHMCQQCLAFLTVPHQNAETEVEDKVIFVQFFWTLSSLLSLSYFRMFSSFGSVFSWCLHFDGVVYHNGRVFFFLSLSKDQLASGLNWSHGIYSFLLLLSGVSQEILDGIPCCLSRSCVKHFFLFLFLFFLLIVFFSYFCLTTWQEEAGHCQQKSRKKRNKERGKSFDSFKQRLLCMSPLPNINNTAHQRYDIVSGAYGMVVLVLKLGLGNTWSK